MESQKELLHKRVRDHRIRDCHGDLHLEHICLTDGIVVFDCIEFNERFRYEDVAAEVAFLAMDLDFNVTPILGIGSRSPTVDTPATRKSRYS